MLSKLRKGDKCILVGPAPKFSKKKTVVLQVTKKKVVVAHATQFHHAQHFRKTDGYDLGPTTRNVFYLLKKDRTPF